MSCPQTTSTPGWHEPPTADEIQRARKLNDSISRHRTARASGEGWAVLTHTPHFIYLHKTVYERAVEINREQRERQALAISDPVPDASANRVAQKAGFQPWTLYHEQTGARTVLDAYASALLWKWISVNCSITRTRRGSKFRADLKEDK